MGRNPEAIRCTIYAGMKKTILTAGLLAALAGIPVMGAPAKTLFVGTFPGSNASCASPGYASVQAAVTAAPAGSTVYLCSAGSPFSGPVAINKSLTLTGDAGTVIEASATPLTLLQLPPQFTTDNLFVPMTV